MTSEEAISIIGCALNNGCRNACNARVRGQCGGSNVFEALEVVGNTIEQIGKLKAAEKDLKDLYSLLQKHFTIWNPREERTELERVGIEIQGIGLQTIDYVLGILEEGE